MWVQWAAECTVFDVKGLNSPAALAPPGVNTQPYTAFPLLGGASVQLYEGASSYSGLQASLEKRFAAGLSFLASYTYSHALDNGDSGLGDTSFRNIILIPLNQERANSDFDTRQRVTFNGSYQAALWQRPSVSEQECRC